MSGSVVLDPQETFASFLEQEQAKDLLRFTTAGSVDDGKSTLIGRLLYDSRSVYEDQLESVTRASVGRNAGAIDFSLLTDGLRAEREQGITIDVAYRYFATPKRKFIIADTPGHEQYTRNMVTGASTAELAIVLVDARKGLLPQSRRHAYISSLLGLPHIVIAVNKMDLVDYSQKVFREIENDFRQFLSGFRSIEPFFVPISALAGDNVVKRSTNMPWFHGQSLLEYLEHVPVGSGSQRAAFRFPVQRVVRPNLDFRGYAGTVSSGSIRAGDEVTILPSGLSSRVARIVTFDGDLTEAHAGQSVTLALSDDLDISRGDLIARSEDIPEVATAVDATFVWLSPEPAQVGKRYRIKHSTSLQSADLRSIHHRTNTNTLDHEQADTLEMNAIGSVRLETARPLVFDPYRRNRITGSLILIDPATNATVAAGMIEGASRAADAGRIPVGNELRPVTVAERVLRNGHYGAEIHLGGHKELAWQLERLLFDRDCNVVRGDSETEAVREALARLGALVLIAGDQAAGMFLHIRGEQLPFEAERPQEIEELLDRKQVFTHGPDWGDSGGI